MDQTQKALISLSITQTLKEIDVIEFETGELLKVFESFDSVNVFVLYSKIQQDALTNLLSEESNTLLNFASTLLANLTLNGVTRDTLIKLSDNQKELLTSDMLGKAFSDLTASDTSLDLLKTLIFIIKLNLKPILIEYSHLLEKYKGK